MQSNNIQECPLSRKTSLTQANFDYENGEIHLTVNMSCSTEKITFIIDTGAEISIVKLNKLDQNTKVNIRDKITISGVTHGNIMRSIGKTFSNIYLSHIPFGHDFHIFSSNVQLYCDGILGNDFSFKYNARINYGTRQIEFEYFSEDGPLKSERKSSISKIKNKNFYDKFHAKYEKQVTLKPIFSHSRIATIKYSQLDKMNEPKERAKIILETLNLVNLSGEQKKYLGEICVNYSDIFRHTRVTEHFIELKPGTAPIFVKQYRIPESYKKEVQRQIDELESRGIIERSSSPWNSPLLLIPKKLSESGERKFRLVIDYRKLNAVTISRSYPIPLVDEIIDQKKGAKLFTVLDLHGAFHQISLNEKCKQYTSFSTAYEKYHFNSSPFGLVGSPFTWLQTISTVLRGIIGQNVFVYMDDIIIHSTTISEHKKTIELVLRRLIENNLKLNMEKSTFFRSEVTYLGHIVSAEGLRTDPKKITCMENFPVPKNITEIQRFLGMCNYYRRYVRDFDKIAKPLHALCRRDIQFIWSEKCQKAFQDLKNSLISPPILIYPDFSDTFIVTTDASEYASVISQGQIPDDLPIQFFSKSLSKAQINYSTIEKELLAIITAIETFRHYLSVEYS